MYIDGEYQEVTTVSLWGDILTDLEGNVHTIEGLHQTGFTYSRRISFADGYPSVEYTDYWKIWANGNIANPIIPDISGLSLIATRAVPDDDIRENVRQILVTDERISE